MLTLTFSFSFFPAFFFVFAFRNIMMAHWKALALNRWARHRGLFFFFFCDNALRNSSTRHYDVMN